MASHFPSTRTRDSNPQPQTTDYLIPDKARQISGSTSKLRGDVETSCVLSQDNYVQSTVPKISWVCVKWGRGADAEIGFLPVGLPLNQPTKVPSQKHIPIL